MRITYRSHNNLEYWTDRWENIPIDSAMDNVDKYPLKYALQAVCANDGRILEAGCGTGRILRYFNDRGYDITGIDFISSVIERLKAADSELKVEVGDITHLYFGNCSFKYVLAFGLYHNLPFEGINEALNETYRILEPGGILCASCRADNFQNRISDWITDRRNKNIDDQDKHFHKINLNKNEYLELVTRCGFEEISVHHVENMPFLYKFTLFRNKNHKVFDENVARRDGYLLSPIGNFFQKALMKSFPEQFCNVNVIIARK